MKIYRNRFFFDEIMKHFEDDWNLYSFFSEMEYNLNKKKIS